MGTPIVAARAGTVQKAGTESDAGNYLVVKVDDGQSQVYMHMLAPAIVRKGQSVAVGQRLGSVGETGRGTGCHLHFELWTAPGWYQGDHPVDPATELRDLTSGADGATDGASMAARRRDSDRKQGAKLPHASHAETRTSRLRPPSRLTFTSLVWSAT